MKARPRSAVVFLIALASSPFLLALGLFRQEEWFAPGVLACLPVVGLAVLVAIYWRTGEAETANRKRSEEALHLRDRAMEAISQGIFIIDPAQPGHPVIYVNPAFERITGYGREDILGMNWGLCPEAGNNSAGRAEIEIAIREQRPRLVELLGYRKDGTSFWASLSLAPIRTAEGRLTHFVGVVTDVSEQKRLEAQLRQSQKMEAIGRLAGGVAHDFNNVLTVILGYSDMLLQKLTPGDASRAPIEEISKAGQRAASLTNQLLAFSRKQVLTPVALNLNTLVADMDKMLRRLIGEDIELTTSLDPALQPAKVDPGQVQQVLMNLVVNARDAMPNGGKLTIKTANVDFDASYAVERPELQPGSYVLVAVSDTGCGMDEATKARIFEPFFTTREPGMGTGLGLATVYGIIKQSGGYIYVNSQPGRGSTFRIYFPRAGQETSQPGQDSAPHEIKQNAATVLVVEDEDAVRAMAARVLQRNGHAVLQARHGEEALQLSAAHTGPIDLLLTDVVMPQMSGCQLAQRMAPIRPAMKVLYMSGYTDEAIVRHGLLSHEVDFLQKPFTGDILAKRVGELLQHSTAGSVPTR
jgi:PAS domain S-box-containing protein